MTDADLKSDKEKRLAQAIERLKSRPTITVEDWAILNDVHRNTAFKEAAAERIEGIYRVGVRYCIPSALWREKLGVQAAA